MNEEENCVEFMVKATFPVTVRMNSNELFCKLCESLSCSALVKPTKYGNCFVNDYEIRVIEELSNEKAVFDKHTGKIFDLRGNLYEILRMLGSEIAPNWENRL